jgi:uncharacterized membrane protein YeaQ/YmgE (transglycosylase-associated protein family)
MGIIAWIILGLLAGVIAKALLPGDDPGGLIITTLIGIAGAFIGGLIVKALGFGDPIDEFFDFSTWLGAIAGAILLLLVYRAFVGRGTRGRTAYRGRRIEGEPSARRKLAALFAALGCSGREDLEHGYVEENHPRAAIAARTSQTTRKTTPTASSWWTSSRITFEIRKY